VQKRILLHWFAWSCVAIATITLIAGALVTSKNAGMAFRDWPTSDGQFMLTYPWLADFARDWDKFLEHGHRLAGMLIGLWSIVLVVFFEKFEVRPTVRWLGRCVLLGVILQGLLGGFRVQLDARGLAMLHGAFAAVVLSLMGAAATMQSYHWPASIGLAESGTNADRLSLGRISAFVVPALLAVQFLVGGMIRHQGRALHEHLGLGILAAIAIVANTVIAFRTKDRWIRSSATALLLVGLVQVSLGAASWITKFGLASFGYVAVADSIVQVTSRSAHTVVGVLLVMTSVVHALRVARVCHQCGVNFGLAQSLPGAPARLSERGGAA
jgi:cytochrome c oxidase assembly protein subunit 15